MQSDGYGGFTSTSTSTGTSTGTGNGAVVAGIQRDGTGL